MQEKQRKAYPSDVSDDEWAFVAPYLTLMTEDAPQRVYPLREVFNGLRYITRAGAPWRWLPNDLPPWHVVYEELPIELLRLRKPGHVAATRSACVCGRRRCALVSPSHSLSSM